MPLDADVTRLGAEMLRYATHLDQLIKCDDVLDALHAVTLPHSKINVLGAALLPVRWGDWSAVEKGRTVFLHDSVPKGWWDEWIELSQAHPGPALALARLSLAPFSNSEMMRKLEPLGIDRVPLELALKYGMRDGLTCPVGGRWVVTYWSRNVLDDALSEQVKAILFMGATFAAIRLQQLVDPQASRLPERAALTAREIAVLRLLSIGHQISECAQLLGLGEETVRSHVKKAQRRLGVRNRTHAVAQAMRMHLIP